MCELIDRSKIGIAIATYNSAPLMERCLSGLRGQDYTVVIFDDASEDDTISIARSVMPEIVILKGDGTSWWGGGTAKAMDKCFSMGCDFVLMLNPDSIIDADGIGFLVKRACNNKRLITAALVINDSDTRKVFWGGSKSTKIPWLPVHINKYIVKKDSDILDVGLEPYKTDEVHGRGVLISRSVYNIIGTLDWKTFPHYGADNDYSMRALSAGIKLEVLPQALTRLVVKNSGMELKSKPFSVSRFIEVYRFLTKRKNGEYIRVLWRLSLRHTSGLKMFPSFLFHLLYIVFRKLHQH